ncbi:MAG: DoxX family protein [Candidatus Paceibacterota bacterium]|jgi:uncharacterized membrane protein YphA (DoxX/SURF4 family)
MFTSLSRQRLGVHLLRLGLATVFLWFGFSQIFNSLSWVAIVPTWAVDLIHLPPAMIVVGNGVFEIVLGSLLALGFFVRPIALVLALHLMPIAFDFGFVATGVRDFGIIISALSLSLIY